jgi:hypothetical protein
MTETECASDVLAELTSGKGSARPLILSAKPLAKTTAVLLATQATLKSKESAYSPRKLRATVFARKETVQMENATRNQIAKMENVAKRAVETDSAAMAKTRIAKAVDAAKSKILGRPPPS